jgi:hypothetical protein
MRISIRGNPIWPKGAMVNTAIDFYRAPAGIVPAGVAEPRASSPAATDRIDVRRLIAMFRRRIGVFLGVSGRFWPWA